MSANSRLFSSIGAQISNFIDIDYDCGTYNLDRQATVNVKSGPVKWSLENKLKDDKSIESELRVAKSFNKETASLICSTKKSPTFTIESDRYNYYSNITAQLKSPYLKLGLIRDYSPKYSFDIRNEYNQNNGKASSDIGIAYIQSKDLTLGLRTRIGQDSSITGLLDYSLAAEYNPSQDKMIYAALNGVQPNTFDEENEEKGGMDVSLGMGIKRDIGTIYGEINYDVTSGNIKGGIGLNRDLGETSDLSVVARLDRTVSVLYTNEVPKMNANLRAGANIELKQGKPEAKMQWKLVFGDSFTKDDFGALGDANVSL